MCSHTAISIVSIIYFSTKTTTTIHIKFSHSNIFFPVCLNEQRILQLARCNNIIAQQRTWTEQFYIRSSLGFPHRTHISNAWNGAKCECEMTMVNTVLRHFSILFGKRTRISHILFVIFGIRLWYFKLWLLPWVPCFPNKWSHTSFTERDILCFFFFIILRFPFV